MLLTGFIVSILSTPSLSVAESAQTSSTFSRRLLGPASELVIASDVNVEKLKNSIRYRREVAWSITQQVIASVNFRDPTEHRIPRWLALYQGSEFARLIGGGNFSQLGLERDWEDLNREPDWNETFFSNWREDQLKSLERARGAASLNRTYFGPEIFGHYYQNAREVSECISELLHNVEPERRCFASEFPSGALAVKAQWQLLSSGLSVFQTDSKTLKIGLGSSDQRWNPLRSREGVPQGAFVVEKNGRRYALTGLHIMIKILPDWFWITLWLSENPRTDFGEDRPAALEREFPDWASYKMCAVSGFEEHGEMDPKFEEDFPSLSASLREIQKALGGSQWCSNPFLEEGRGNMATNCIGCHQHAGSLLSQEEILSDPHLARMKSRDLRPADYMWSFNQGSDPLGYKRAPAAASLGLRGLQFQRELSILDETIGYWRP